MLRSALILVAACFIAWGSTLSTPTDAWALRKPAKEARKPQERGEPEVPLENLLVRRESSSSAAWAGNGVTKAHPATSRAGLEERRLQGAFVRWVLTIWWSR